MTKFRHGFKAQCERRSLETRKRLGLSDTSPLSAFDLAKEFGTTVWSLSEIEDLAADDFRQLTEIEGDDWDAFTLCANAQHLVVFNPNASEPRTNSVCMHELSHIILGHKLVDVGVTVDGHLIPSHYNQQEEDEANWLAGALLLPRPAVLSIRRRGLSDRQVRSEYLVSTDMLNWRIRMTGVDYQLGYKKRARVEG